ncbi:5-oxoprolinase subunit PxpA [Rhizobium sp. NPDC090275]|uniref:5-oxoprolinase subunit PxpA n=1 Tax=Rhizobium sp. NPDC090275 TaxID=3364498 RepID=UPI00383AB3AD
MKIDLNSDMGEGFGPYRLCDDEAMMGVVSSANIACGFHGGEPDTMAKMVRLARENGVGIGAHPGLPDRAGFGRREIAYQPDELRQQMIYQLGALQAIARAEDMTVGHFSFHAAMGNMVNRDPALADLMMDAIAKVDARLVVFVTPDSEIERAAKRARLKTLSLFLADRAYDAAGKLVARGLPGALVKDERSVRARVRRFLTEGKIEAIDGTIIDMPARSILVHSDTPGSLELAKLIREEIAAAGAKLASVAELAS